MLAASSSGTIVMSKWAISSQEHGILSSRDVKVLQVHTVDAMELLQQLQLIKLLSSLRSRISSLTTRTSTTSRGLSTRLTVKEWIGTTLILLTSIMFTLRVIAIVPVRSMENCLRDFTLFSSQAITNLTKHFKSNMMDRSFSVSAWQLLFRPTEMHALKSRMVLMLELLVFFFRLVKITLINFSSGAALQAKETKMLLV